MSIRTTRTILAAALIGATPFAHAASFDHSVMSEKSAEPTNIEITVHLPGSAGASSTEQFPVVLHSHGWSGRKSDNPGDFQAYLDNNFAVVSISQRGHGTSGGQANIEAPEYEGEDVIAVIDYVAAQPWSLKNKQSDAVTENDPVLFAIGGSYGGAYQWAGLLQEMKTRGYKGKNKTRFDAIAPQITWYNLIDALAPNGVTRTVYLSGLYGVKSAQGPQTLPDYVHESYAYIMSTGQLNDGTVPGFTNAVEEFTRHGPIGYDLDGKVNIPTLMRQGSNDVLFNMNQGYQNFSRMLTPKAFNRSLFIGYNGGHLDLTQAAFPRATNPNGDPCSAQITGGQDFTQLTIAFFQAVMDGENPRREVGARQPYYVADDTNNCIVSDSLEPTRPFSVETVEIPMAGAGVGTTAGLGAPIYTEIAGTEGLRISGVSRLEGTAYAAAVDARMFVGLAKGSSPENAVVIHNNVMPARFLAPTAGGNLPTDTGHEFSIELAGVAATLAAGEKLYLVISAIHPQFIGHGSRTPGGIVIGNAQLHLPVR